jgi:hypothetical protein
MAAFRIISRMMSPELQHDTRTLTLVLPESEWRALRAIEPDAVGWLQDRIRERLAHSAAGGYSSRTHSPDMPHDEY